MTDRLYSASLRALRGFAAEATDWQKIVKMIDGMICDLNPNVLKDDEKDDNRE
ncbi:MAG: hypothetical protein LBC65_00055 [Oscillospiraceae bacterium]|jgi:hypothetical protein|nr:hypothetical protein [Oscillospiraceae bacterium]